MASTENEQYDRAKEQIAQLETELAEFQASSRELEQELEAELQESEERHLQSQLQINKLNAEIDDWKVCFVFFFLKKKEKSWCCDAPTGP